MQLKTLLSAAILASTVSASAITLATENAGGPEMCRRVGKKCHDMLKSDKASIKSACAILPAEDEDRCILVEIIEQASPGCKDILVTAFGAGDKE